MLLRSWRKSAGLSLEEAAGLFVVSIAGLSEIERGLNWPTAEAVVRIWEATRQEVTLADHWVAWGQANREKFNQARDTGRAARRAFPKPIRLKGPRNGGKTQKRR